MFQALLTHLQFLTEDGSKSLKHVEVCGFYNTVVSLIQLCESVGLQYMERIVMNRMENEKKINKTTCTFSCIYISSVIKNKKKTFYC
jgi:hypothetical protein